MLEATDIRARLAGREVLQGITLAAAPGSLTAIIGPNGSGKTTLIRCLTGDLACTGQVRLNGLPVTRGAGGAGRRGGAAAAARRLAGLRAVLAQETHVAFPFTVEEIVRMGQMAGSCVAPDSSAPDLPAPDLPSRALAEVGLAGYGGRDYQALSGGERQRVQLARVLVQVWQPTGPDGARWLFLDEPVSSLDIGHQLQVMRIARSFADRGGGVVAVMHDLNLSAMFADRLALIHHGRLLAAGPPAAVLSEANLARAYGCPIRINRAPESGPWLLPQAVDAG